MHRSIRSLGATLALWCAGVSLACGGVPIPEQGQRVDGYRGIWFTLGQPSQYGDKYSGGLGTYTANHVPMAVYAPEVNKTFFTYGGTSGKDERQLVIMVSYYDHARNEVPRPVVLQADAGVDDPHDDACIHIAPDGHVWVFKSGRNTRRLGFIYRSKQPYSIDGFERVDSFNMTYPQVAIHGEKGFFLLFTKYTAGRELYWKTSKDGRTWTPDAKLAGFGGHYQVSGMCGDKIGTFFNYHPNHSVDRRTNLYYAQTTDWGKTWTTIDGKPLTLPLANPHNEALVFDFQAEGKLMYTCDLNFDREGRPILLYVTSHHHAPGPQGDPREWRVTHWNGSAWETSVVTTSGHNYDMGSLYVNGDEWRIIGPTERGPQQWGSGGEMALWISRDAGKTWKKERQITHGSAFNHDYARRPLHAANPFWAFWADGNPNKISPSRLYFTDSDGQHVWQLPYDMPGETAHPTEVTAVPGSVPGK